MCLIAFVQRKRGKSEHIVIWTRHFTLGKRQKNGKCWAGQTKSLKERERKEASKLNKSRRYDESEENVYKMKLN